MKKVFVLQLIFSTLFYSKAQETSFKELFTDAEYYFYEKDYYEALYYYLKFFQSSDSANANICYRIGVSYLMTNNEKVKAIPYLETAVKNITPDYKEGNIKENKAPLDALLFLGDAYLINNEIDKAINTYKAFENTNKPQNYETKEYMEIVKRKLETCNDAKELQEIKVKFTSKCIANPISTKLPELNPVLSSDGKILYYTSRQKFFDGIFYSTKDGENWGIPKNFNFEIKADGNLSVSSISPDGKQLFIYIEDNGIGNIYISTMLNNHISTMLNNHISTMLNNHISTNDNMQWSQIKKLNICSMSDETHACVSPDSRTLYFVSNRRGGFGAQDIYKSDLDANGKWNEPINLGPKINTPFDEDSPFILGDGNVMFFSSQGHYNLGGFDIFRTQMLDNGEWSEPVNIGYPVNTTDDEKGFYPFDNGRSALMARISKECGGETDIFEYNFSLPQGQSQIEVSGNLIIADTNKILKDDVRINIFNLEASREIESIKPDLVTRKFSAILTAGKYKFSIMSGKNEKISQIVALPKIFYNASFNFKKEIYEKDGLTQDKAKIIALQPNREDDDTPKPSLPASGVQTSGKLHICNMLFDFNSYKTDNYIENMNTLAEYLVKNPSVKIEIAGYSDLQGDVEYNLQLSQKRAETVKNYLGGKGATGENITATGYGENNQVSINISPSTRKYNRRVEFKAISQGIPELIIDPVEIPEEYRIK